MQRRQQFVRSAPLLVMPLVVLVAGCVNVTGEPGFKAGQSTPDTTEEATLPDTTPPETVIDSGPSGTVNNAGASFGFSASDASEIDHLECKLSGSSQAHDWTLCTSPKSYSDLADATYTFEVRASDAALNVDSTPASRTWTVDTSGGGAATHWVSIPGGSFSMGDAFAEGASQELPVHMVTLSAFDMYAYEVTNGEYEACVLAGLCSAPSSTSSYSLRNPYYGNSMYTDYPVIYVDWQQASDFCTWIAVGGRLPTEAEWEYAARGGLSGQRFPWGDTIDCTEANYFTNDTNPYDVELYVGSKFCATSSDTMAVGSFAANGYGLYDMAGNVWEWVNDWYDSTYYTSSLANDPQGPASGIYRMLRGGSFNFGADFARVAERFFDDPTNQNSSRFGFRCAR